MSEQQLEVKEFDHPPLPKKLAQDDCHYLARPGGEHSYRIFVYLCRRGS